MTSFCLITGASGGIGAHLAREAARAGYDLILSARSLARLEPLADELRAMGRDVVCIAADLSLPDAGAALWQEASSGREITVLVNNAGLGVHGPVSNPGIAAQEQSVVAVNVVAATALMKAAAVEMAAKRRGYILNVSSSAAFMPGPGMATYHASKAYLLYLSEAASVDLKPSGVSVTALCPGPTETGFFDAGNVNGALALKFLPKARPEAVARVGWQGMMAGKRMVVPGLLYKLIGFSLRFMPRALVLWVAQMYWRK
ncbi:SDR family NAD(P)-dependent oxidoreductase [Rhodobacteraceae bacterium LMO-12]|nr:SDR family NAD(P)-dependent oxidoreductase [Rhodobacteraceae bacterium LMO-JJ12]